MEQQKAEAQMNGSAQKSVKELFCDPEFPVEEIPLPEHMKDTKCFWRRPCELRKKPRLFVDGAKRSDIIQGGLGDCWFLAACSAVAEHPELIKKVIPGGQALFGDRYDGGLFFRFWHLGRWQKVEIDDRLPVDSDDDLLMGRCKDPDEFWLPLLEKAFAKFHGGYEALDGGRLPEGFVNLTGYSVQPCPNVERGPLFKYLRREWLNGSLIICARYDPDYSQGLPGGHGYTVTALHRLRTKSGLVRLVRVRNPHGQTEWTGAWNENDVIWNTLSDSIKKKLEYKNVDDGEYWMKFAHFVEKFDDLVVAVKAPAIDDKQEEEENKCNICQQVRGRWRAGLSAGGSTGYNSRATNPQYVLYAEEADCPEDEDDLSQNEVESVLNEIKNGNEIEEQREEEEDKVNSEKSEPTCNVYIELMQEHNRRKVKELMEIAIFVYERTEEKRLTGADLEEMEPENTPKYEAISAVHVRLSLKPRVPYIILVSTMNANEERGFLLRVFSRKPCIRLQELPVSSDGQ